MKKLTLRLLPVILFVALFSAACADNSDNNNEFLGGDNDADATVREESTGFKGGSTVGNPSEVDIRIVTRGGLEGGPDWGEISLGVHNVFLSSGIWNSTTFGEELISDSENDHRLELGERSRMRLTLEAPPDIEFSSLDLRLSKDSGAFKAEGTLDGRNISIETGLFGLLPFSAQRGNYRWEADGSDSLIAVLDTDAMIAPETLAALLEADSGDIRVDLSHNEKFLTEINRSVIAAFRLYRDLDGDGVLDANEQVETNLLSYGNPDRAENWDQTWPAMSCANMEESGWQDLSHGYNFKYISGSSQLDLVALENGERGLWQFDGSKWRYVEVPDELINNNVFDIWRRGVGDTVFATDYSVFALKNGVWQEELRYLGGNANDVELLPVSPDVAYLIVTGAAILEGIYVYSDEQWSLFVDFNETSFFGGGPAVSSDIVYAGENKLWLLRRDQPSNIWLWDGNTWTERADIISDIEAQFHPFDGFNLDLPENVVGGDGWLLFAIDGYLVEWDNGEVRTYDLTQSEGVPVIKKAFALSKNDVWYSAILPVANPVDEWHDKQTVLLHLDGSNVTKFILEKNSKILDMCGSAGNSVWFTGNSTEPGNADDVELQVGRLWYWDGAELSTVINPSSDTSIVSPAIDSIKLLWGTSTSNMFMATFNGLLFRLSGGVWTQMQFPAMESVHYIFSAKAYGSDQAYFITLGAFDETDQVHDCSLMHFDGENLEKLMSFDCGIITMEEYAVPASMMYVASSSSIWIAGNDKTDGNGVVLHWNGDNVEYTKFNDFPAVYSIFGVDDSHIWIMTFTWEERNFSSMMFWNGSGWEEQSVEVFFPITSNYAFSENDVWGLSENKIVHYDGSQWSVVTEIDNHWLSSIRGFGMDNLFIVGYRGSMLQWNGSEWNESSACTDSELSSILGLSGRELWIGGEAGALMRYRE